VGSSRSGGEEGKEKGERGRMNHLSQTLGISEDAGNVMGTAWWGSGVKPPEMVAEAKLALERQNEVVLPSVVRTVTQSCSEAIDSLKETLTYDMWCVRRPPPPFPFENTRCTTGIPPRLRTEGFALLRTQ
jgi:hypothetical protein